MTNNKTLGKSQDKSYLAQIINDIKFSRYRKIVVIGLNSEQKNNLIKRKPPEFFKWGGLNLRWG